MISLTLTSRRRHTPSTQISEDLLLSVVGAEEALGHEVTLGTLLEAGADRLDLSLRIAGSKNGSLFFFLFGLFWLLITRLCLSCL